MTFYLWKSFGNFQMCITAHQRILKIETRNCPDSSLASNMFRTLNLFFLCFLRCRSLFFLINRAMTSKIFVWGNNVHIMCIKVKYRGRWLYAIYKSRGSKAPRDLSGVKPTFEVFNRLKT